MKHLFGNKNGYLLPIVIIYMIITMIVGAGIMVLGSLDRIEANKRLHREQAFYLAEAGINLAYYNLNNNFDLPTGSQPVNSGTWTGTFELFLETGTETDTITSIGKVKTGAVNEVSEKIIINVTKNGTFSQGIFGNNGVTLSSSSAIYGDVTSNTLISLSQSSHIDGDTTGDTLLKNSAKINGTQHLPSDWPPLKLVSIPTELSGHAYPNDYSGTGPNTNPATITATAGTYTISNGALTVEGSSAVTINTGVDGTESNNFHFKSITISSSAQVYVTGNIRFYVENNFSLNSSCQMTLPSGEMYIGTSGNISINGSSNFQNRTGIASNFGIYVASDGSLTFNSSSESLAAAIYAPLATVTLNSSVVLNGDVVAEEVILNSSAQLHYDESLKDSGPTGSGEYDSGIPNFINWTKPDWKK